MIMLSNKQFKSKQVFQVPSGDKRELVLKRRMKAYERSKRRLMSAQIKSEQVFRMPHDDKEELELKKRIEASERLMLMLPIRRRRRKVKPFFLKSKVTREKAFKYFERNRRQQMWQAFVLWYHWYKIEYWDSDYLQENSLRWGWAKRRKRWVPVQKEAQKIKKLNQIAFPEMRMLMVYRYFYIERRIANRKEISPWFYVQMFVWGLIMAYLLWKRMSGRLGPIS